LSLSHGIHSLFDCDFGLVSQKHHVEICTNACAGVETIFVLTSDNQPSTLVSGLCQLCVLPKRAVSSCRTAGAVIIANG